MGDGLYESVAAFKARAYERVGADRLGQHLADHYGTTVTGTTELDGGVFRVDRADGPPWVARLFPLARPVEAVQGDAEVLDLVARHGFPAERTIDDPVTEHEGQGVLVTELVDGTNARGDTSPRIFTELGALLGRLHSIDVPDGATSRAAGSWHSLSIAGGGRDADVRALRSLLADAATRAPSVHVASVATLDEELAALDVGEGLPTALTHPDFCPANVMRTPDGGYVLVDWTGAGTAPRVSGLGLLLSSTGGNPSLVDSVMASYLATLGDALEPAELDRLEDAIRGFGFVLGCWGVIYWGAPASQVVAGLAPTRAFARAIADRARQATATAVARPD